MDPAEFHTKQSCDSLLHAFVMPNGSMTTRTLRCGGVVHKWTSLICTLFLLIVCVTGLSFPGTSFGSPVHYVLWTRSATPLRARLFTPVLVGARTGELTGAYPMPWYLRFLETSRPLHFGDYGGMPQKTLWALLDVVVIGVLVSGLVLWAGKRRIATDVRLRALGCDLDDADDAAIPVRIAWAVR
jgi:uncharacterized iron-regulated membrane protein